MKGTIQLEIIKYQSTNQNINQMLNLFYNLLVCRRDLLVDGKDCYLFVNQMLNLFYNFLDDGKDC